jgi:hypothetical protein
MDIIKYIKWSFVAIFEIITWSFIYLVELFVNIITVLVTILWIMYILNFVYYFTGEVFNYLVPNYTKTCYLILGLEYCVDNIIE